MGVKMLKCKARGYKDNGNFYIGCHPLLYNCESTTVIIKKIQKFTPAIIIVLVYTNAKVFHFLAIPVIPNLTPMKVVNVVPLCYSSYF